MPTRLRLRARITFLALRKSGVRALLALAAVGMGIAAMIVLLALGTGARLELEAINDQMGKNLFSVTAGKVLATPERGGGWYTSTRLDRADLAAMRSQIRGIRAIVPILEGSLPVKLGRGKLVTSVRGVPPEFLAVRNFHLDEGRALDERDGLARSRVAVVGAFVAKKLNAGFSMVGEAIWIGGVPFEVIGQLREKGVSLDGQNEDDQVLIPLETARRRLFNVEYLSRLLVQVEDPAQMEAVEGQVREVLRASHDLDADVKDDFDILNLIRASVMRKLNNAFVEGLARIFAAITLAIGGAGVLAVTYLNVKDRTSEIGLRMAIGARRRDIASLFVAEACLLSMLGGLAGLVAGWAAVALLERATGWRMAIDLRGVAIPLLVAVLLGLAAGLLPALQAAKLMPVEALRDS